MRKIEDEEISEALQYVVGSIKQCSELIYCKFLTGELTLLKAIRHAEIMMEKRRRRQQAWAAMLRPRADEKLALADPISRARVGTEICAKRDLT